MRNRSLNYSKLYYGDIVLVDYGKRNDGRMTRGIKPSIVVSSDSSIEDERYIYVIPLYRKVISYHKTESILVKKNENNRLKYDEYIQPMFLQRIHKGRVTRIIGNVDDSYILDYLSSTVGRMFNITKGGGD